MRLCKVFLCIMLATAFLLSALSCGSGSPPPGANSANDANDQATVSPYTPRQIAEVILGAIADKPPMLPLTREEAYFTDYLTQIYMLEEDAAAEGIIYYANGVYATEIAVLILTDQADVAAVKDALTEYLLQREKAFAGYAPGEAEILRKSLVTSRGKYVALLICAEPQRAESVFVSCFSSQPPPLPEEAEEIRPEEREEGLEIERETGETAIVEREGPLMSETDTTATTAEESGLPPETRPMQEEYPHLPDPAANEETHPEPAAKTSAGDDPTHTQSDPDNPTDQYNPDAILAAWGSGDRGALSLKNRQILDACADVIEELITEDMSDYRKELTIHDWIIKWADYDKGALSNAPDAKPDPDNDNPYGLLIQKKAICRGFTSTFQLFMDMLDVECISVDGSSVNGEHAWNMVRLDGEWYCVDVTWNNPVNLIKTEAVTHKYFNVPSEFMRTTGHEWEEDLTPEATAPKLYKR